MAEGERAIERVLVEYDAAARQSACEKFLPHVDTYAETIERLDLLFSSGKPFSFIRISDTDALLLCWKLAKWEKHRALLKNLLFWSGVRTLSLRDSENFWNIVLASTLSATQEPLYPDNFSFWAPFYIYLVESGNLGCRRWNSLHAIYQYTASGLLGQQLSGKRVVMVGGKVEIFRDYFYRNKHWHEAFPFLRFNEIDVVGWVATPDLPDSSYDAREEIEAAVRNTYSLRPDVFLLSSGLLAKLLAVQVMQEHGAVGLDIGNVLESIMNLQCRRPFMERFSTYEHPTHRFIFLDYLRVQPEPRGGA